MALFGKQKSVEEKEVKVKEVSRSRATTGGAVGGHISDVLRSPRITEKASSNMSVGVYTFAVSDRSTKRGIAEAVFEIYNVRPRMIRIVPIRRKVRRNARTGQLGMSRGGKKAYVYLKKGETITII